MNNDETIIMNENRNADPVKAMHQENRAANFLSQTSPTRSLTNIDWMLKGFVYNEQKKDWEKVSRGVPDEMRLDIMQQLTTVLSEDVRMGRLDRTQINFIMETMIQFVVDYLDSKADSYFIDIEKDKWILKNESEQIAEREVNIKGYNLDYGWGYEYKNNFTKENLRQITEDDLSRLAWIVLGAIFYTLARAENGVERDLMYKSLKIGDDFSAYNQNEKKGVMDILKPWR